MTSLEKCNQVFDLTTKKHEKLVFVGGIHQEPRIDHLIGSGGVNAGQLRGWLRHTWVQPCWLCFGQVRQNRKAWQHPATS